jgi:hypothetical protein
MKYRDAGLTFGLGLLSLFPAPIGLAKQPVASDSGKWMLEITQANGTPDYVSASGSGRFEDQYVTYLNRDRDANRLQPSSVELLYRVRGTAASVRIFLRFDPSTSRSDSVKRLSVGTYVMLPGQSITITELSRYGIQPMQVKLVTAEPPWAIQPEIANETSSMVVEKVDQDRGEYKLFLRNASEVAVNGIVVSVFGKDGRCRMHNQRALSGRFMPPGASGELHVSLPDPEDEGVEGSDGLSCSDAPQAVSGPSQRTNSSGTRTPKIVIEAVDFEDGSYEGDDRKAAMLEAERLGREIERPRIIAVVEKQLASNERDGMAKLASVQSQVSALSDNVDSAVLMSIMARFPTVPDSAKQSIERDIRNGLRMEKATFLNNLRLYLFELSKQLTSDPSLQRWWNVTKGRCDWLAPRTCPDSE